MGSEEAEDGKSKPSVNARRGSKGGGKRGKAGKGGPSARGGKGGREPEVWRVLDGQSAAEVRRRPSPSAPILDSKLPGEHVRVSCMDGEWLRLHGVEGYGPEDAWVSAAAVQKQEIQLWKVVSEQDVPLREEPSRLALEVGHRPPGSMLRVAYREGDWLRVSCRQPAWVLAKGLLGSLMEREGAEEEAASKEHEGEEAEEPLLPGEIAEEALPAQGAEETGLPAEGDEEAAAVSHSPPLGEVEPGAKEGQAAGQKRRSHEGPVKASGSTRRGSGGEPEVWRVRGHSASAPVPVRRRPSALASAVGQRQPGSFVRVARREGPWVRLHSVEGFGQEQAWMPVYTLEKQEIQIWRVVSKVVVREEPSCMGRSLGMKLPGSKVRVAYLEGHWARVHSKTAAWVLTERDGERLLECEGPEGEAEARLPALEDAGPLTDVGFEPPGPEEEDGELRRAGGAGEAAAEGAAPAAGVTVREGALPLALAEEVRDRLMALPAEAWELIVTKDQPVGEGERRIPIRFHRLEKDSELLKQSIMETLQSALAPQPYERIFMNFSKYEEGDFLHPHTDTPSSTVSYQRRSSFIWYLTKGWSEEDGGVFVDEEAEGGPRQIVPSFNALVTFRVPHRHSVTKVTAASKARFAVYGWVVEPQLERLGSASELTALLQSTRGKALAVEFARAPRSGAAAAALATFAGLAVEDVGPRSLGEFCVFATTDDEGVARALGVPEAAGAAVAVVADPAAFSRGEGGCQVCVDAALDPAELLRFVNSARKVFSPCGELDVRDSLLMADLAHSPEVKVFLFMPPALREPLALRRLDAWAAALRPRGGARGVRMLLVDPGRNRGLQEDFGLADDDLPTAVAEDTMGRLGLLHFKDTREQQGSGLDLESLRQWLGRLARSAGLAQPELP